nr:MAG TPA: hypothetical protein [Caudoviricetes sp.]
MNESQRTRHLSLVLQSAHGMVIDLRKGELTLAPRGASESGLWYPSAHSAGSAVAQCKPSR